MSGPRTAELVRTLLDWYGDNRRDLPWRAPGTSAWAVLVSEVMLQQTPVERVRPVWHRWLARWPEPKDLAAEPAGAAVRDWDSLGYPRRALRLHAAAVVCRDLHGNDVPADLAQLRALPGVGEYTAAAVAAFAHGRREVVLDTNVRRVLARLVTGVAEAGPQLSAAERAAARALLPVDPATAARWSVAVMELGALVCTARAPRCERCPVSGRCRWLALGRPADPGRRRPGRTWTGSDRQARGRLLGVLRRRAGEPTDDADLAAAWPPEAQRQRALAGLVADGLAEPAGPGVYRLPGLSVPGGQPEQAVGGVDQGAQPVSSAARQVARAAKGSGL